MKKITLILTPLVFFLAACSSPDGGILSSETGLSSASTSFPSLAKTTYSLAGQIQFAPAGTQIVHLDGTTQTAIVGDDVYVGEFIKNVNGSSYKVDINGDIIIITDPSIATTITFPDSVDYFFHEDWVPINQDTTVYTSKVKVAPNGSCILTT